MRERVERQKRRVREERETHATWRLASAGWSVLNAGRAQRLTGHVAALSVRDYVSSSAVCVMTRALEDSMDVQSRGCTRGGLLPVRTRARLPCAVR